MRTFLLGVIITMSVLWHSDSSSWLAFWIFIAALIGVAVELIHGTTQPRNDPVSWQ